MRCGHRGGLDDGGGLGDESGIRAGGRHFEDDKSCYRASSGLLVSIDSDIAVEVE
jgi:hypothetical protein